MNEEPNNWFAIGIAVVGVIVNAGALLQWNHSRNAERDKDRDRMAHLESDVSALQRELAEEKASTNAHMDRIYAALAAIQKSISFIEGRLNGSIKGNE